MPQRSPRWRALEPVSAFKLNQMSQRIDDLNKQFAGPTTVGGTPLVRIVQLEVLSIDNALRTISGIIPGTSGAPSGPFIYNVQLPKLCTETSRAGNTYAYTDLNTRVVNGGPTTEEITPNILVGDEIVAMDLKAGVRWELALDGRMWAELPP